MKRYLNFKVFIPAFLMSLLSIGFFIFSVLYVDGINYHLYTLIANVLIWPVFLLLKAGIITFDGPMPWFIAWFLVIAYDYLILLIILVVRDIIILFKRHFSAFFVDRHVEKQKKYFFAIVLAIFFGLGICALYSFLIVAFLNANIL